MRRLVVSGEVLREEDSGLHVLSVSAIAGVAQRVQLILRGPVQPMVGQLQQVALAQPPLVPGEGVGTVDLVSVVQTQNKCHGSKGRNETGEKFENFPKVQLIRC